MWSPNIILNIFFDGILVDIYYYSFLSFKKLNVFKGYLGIRRHTVVCDNLIYIYNFDIYDSINIFVKKKI